MSLPLAPGLLSNSFALWSGVEFCLGRLRSEAQVLPPPPMRFLMSFLSWIPLAVLCRGSGRKILKERSWF